MNKIKSFFKKIFFILVRVLLFFGLLFMLQPVATKIQQQYYSRSKIFSPVNISYIDIGEQCLFIDIGKNLVIKGIGNKNSLVYSLHSEICFTENDKLINFNSNWMKRENNEIILTNQYQGKDINVKINKDLQVIIDAPDNLKSMFIVKVPLKTDLIINDNTITTSFENFTGKDTSLLETFKVIKNVTISFYPNSFTFEPLDIENISIHKSGKGCFFYVIGKSFQIIPKIWPILDNHQLMDNSLNIVNNNNNYFYNNGKLISFVNPIKKEAPIFLKDSYFSKLKYWFYKPKYFYFKDNKYEYKIKKDAGFFYYPQFGILQTNEVMEKKEILTWTRFFFYPYYLTNKFVTGKVLTTTKCLTFALLVGMFVYYVFVYFLIKILFPIFTYIKDKFIGLGFQLGLEAMGGQSTIVKKIVYFILKPNIFIRLFFLLIGFFLVLPIFSGLHRMPLNIFYEESFGGYLLFKFDVVKPNLIINVLIALLDLFVSFLFNKIKKIPFNKIEYLNTFFLLFVVNNSSVISFLALVIFNIGREEVPLFNSFILN